MIGEGETLQVAVQLLAQGKGNVFAGYCAQSALEKGENAVEQIQADKHRAQNP